MNSYKKMLIEIQEIVSKNLGDVCFEIKPNSCSEIPQDFINGNKEEILSVTTTNPSLATNDEWRAEKY